MPSAAATNRRRAAGNHRRSLACGACGSASYPCPPYPELVGPPAAVANPIARWVRPDHPLRGVGGPVAASGGHPILPLKSITRFAASFRVRIASDRPARESVIGRGGIHFVAGRKSCRPVPTGQHPHPLRDPTGRELQTGRANRLVAGSGLLPCLQSVVEEVRNTAPFRISCLAGSRQSRQRNQWCAWPERNAPYARKHAAACPECAPPSHASPK